MVAQRLGARLDRQVPAFADLLRIALHDAGTIDRLEEQLELVACEIGTARVFGPDVAERLVAAQRGLG